ncbi:SusC/RagA family TonB-linked outer membrane protein [Sinomicrobium soli]|uniref:SusC/RagA family TonB-linked outer membrane protein n=1 Tax=Sinomicrobium sp. N-1-3-6 TaxID=2219864 RepID=UPI000DCB889B|nr:TonB-dependent receptor [Sinomicrobium sp. N-1-3-6]RAV27742.1 SusC/RagA family TonB-linked outer membrane protein [Sinomicrobium sp. N-1-3-6]
MRTTKDSECMRLGCILNTPYVRPGLLLGLVLIAFSVHLRAQQDATPSQLLAVSGIVTDSVGVPLPGVTVMLKESPEKGTVTDMDGHYSISDVNARSTLVFSYIGFETREYAVNSREAIDIVMQESVTALNEIVVVGYGVQKKASVTGSVASIRSEELKRVKVPNVTNMLAGRLPGLRAVQRSGAPGDDGASIDIRGYGGMLVIVDGVQRDFSQLDPNDIESISILKDASAAVYGFKGSNGVLLVTTKKGNPGKPRIEYNGYAGLQEVTRYPGMMNAYEYASLYNEAIYNTNPWTGIPAYTVEQLESYRNGHTGTRWWDAMTRDYAPQTAHNLSVTGGTEKVKYFTSAGFLDQEGILKSEDWNYRRYNVRSNIDMEVAKGLTVSLKLSGQFDKRERPYDADNLFRQAQMAVPTYSVYANGNPNYWQAVGDMANPVHTSYSSNSGYENRMRREFNGSLALDWNIPWVEGFKARAMMAYDYRNKEWKTWQKELSEYTYDAAADIYEEKILRARARLESKFENYYKPTYQFSLNYNRNFEEIHDVGAMVLWEMYDDRLTWLSGAKDFTMGLIDDLDYGDTENQATGGRSVETAHAGLVGKFNYAFNNRYLLELSFRYDGSYKFMTEKRWGFFPGISAGWRLSEESFFRELMPDMDNLKIRGSYAKVGDEGDFDAYQYLSGYEYSGSYVLGSNGLSTGLRNSGMPNTWLTWYESEIVNFGFEFSYKRGLVSAEFDWFRRHRTGLPASRQGSLPTTFGESFPQENLNSDINTGFEFRLGHKNEIGALKYNVSANFSVTRIKNDYIERALPTNSFDNWRNNTNDRYKDIRWGKQVIGQFGSYEEILNAPIQDNNGNKSLLPGDLRFADINGDGVIDGKDDTVIGHGSTPRMYYGLNLGATYKGFDMNMFFQGAAGHDMYINGDILDPFIQQGLGNGLALMTDRWHRADPSDPYSEWIPGQMPAARVTGLEANRSGNTWSLHKADYLRLKSIEIGYTLPGDLVKSFGLQGLRFYFNGNNVLTFTKREGLMQYIDPENSSSMVRYYPQLRTFNLGVNITM